MTTTTPPGRYAASSVHAFLDLLDDPVLVLVLGRDARLAFVNRAAADLLGCKSGWAIDRLEPLVGAGLAGWLGALSPDAAGLAVRLGLSAGAAAPATPVPDAVLPDGRRARVSAAPVDRRCWAVTLHVRTVPSPGPDATPRACAETLRLLWESPLPALLHDRRWRIIDANDAALAVVGLTRGQLLGSDPVDLLDLAERVPYEAARRECAERAAHGLPPDPAPPPIESLVVDADGRGRWFRVSHRRLAGPDGEPLTLVTFEDVTAVHEARRFDDWFDRSPVGMVLFDDDGSVVRANRACAALVGRLPRRLDDADDAVQKLLLWTPHATASELPEGSGAAEREAWLPQSDGGARRLRTTVYGHQTERGRRGYFAMIEDRSAEEALDLARLQVGVLMGSAGAALATIPESAGWPPADGDAAAPAGGPSAALSQAIRRSLVAADSLAAFDDMQQALREGRRAEARYEIRHPEFGSRWLLTRVEPGRLASGRRTVSVVTLDITEQHAAQRRNEQLLREMTTILESTTAGMAYVRDGVLMRCNSRFEHMLGLQPGQGINRSMAGLLADWPQAQRIVAETLHALATVNVYETEFEGRAGTGAARGRPPRWFSLSVRRTDAPAPGHPAQAGVEVIAVLADVTRLKSQQRELEALGRDLELMFSLSEVAMAFVRGERIKRPNQALATLLGCAVETLADLAHRELYADAGAYDAQRASELETLLAEGRWSGDRRMRRRDGSLVWVHVSERLVAPGDLGGGMIVSYADVDARYRAEHSLVLQGERTRAILDSALIGIVTVGDHGIEWMNRSAQRMFGATLAAFVGQPMSTVASPEAAHPFRRTYDAADLVEGQAETFECRLQARDGRSFWVAGNVVATGSESTGRQLTYALLDIDRRRAAEARSAETQNELQRLIEFAPLAITLHDAATQRVVRLNPMAASVVGVSVDEARGRTPQELYPPELAAAISADMRSALAGHDAPGGHAELRRDYVFRIGGEARIFDTRYLPMASEGVPTEVLLVATDVTEQRAAQEAQEARYAAAVAQREMLIKEVHHRIKNNLQGVAGLLQDIAMRRPEVAPAINEAVGQMQAIAQVYGLQVGATGPLALAGVIEAVTRSVERIFGRPIALTIDPGAMRWLLPEAESIPIALSANELLTNAIKHSRLPASAPRDTGEALEEGVSCSVRSDAEGVSIVIGNDGQLLQGFSLAGFPGGVSGLGLVRALLPRRSSRLAIEQSGSRVAATVRLVPPGIFRAPDA